MSQYGDIAILAVELFPDLQDARDAWQMATEALGQQAAPQEVQDTFLSLCHAGKVLGIPAEPSGVPAGSGRNVLRALEVLQRSPEPLGGSALIQKLHPDSPAQDELEVLLALWEVGLLNGELSEV